MDMPKLFTVLSLWISKSVAILVVSMLSFNTIVLGNDRVLGSMAAVFAGLVVTIVDYITEPVMIRMGAKSNDKRLRMGFYFVLCAIALWIIKRFALVTGFGVSNNFVVLILAATVTLIDAPVKELFKKVKLEG